MSQPSPIALCLEGRLPPALALARLILQGLSPDEIGPLLPPHSTLAALYRAQRPNLDALAAMLRDSGTDHDRTGDGAVAAIAAMFDRAVALAPEASVAAYSLGDPVLLAATTAEVVDWLLARGYAGTESDVLDLGCGIGRVAGALAPRVRSILGLDVSEGMVAEARRRHAHPALRFAVTNGLPPTGLPEESFDLVLAVDSFPYLVQAGIAEAHVGEAARLLRPGGWLVILNLSYRDAAADGADAAAWAERFGMALLRTGEQPFQLWDGAATVLRRPARGQNFAPGPLAAAGP